MNFGLDLVGNGTWERKGNVEKGKRENSAAFSSFRENSKQMKSYAGHECAFGRKSVDNEGGII